MTTNDAQLIEMERLMRSAPEPGGMENLTSLGDGVAVTKVTVESAGHVTMWNTDTLEPSVFNMNSIRTKMREVFSSDYETISMRGKPCWTATQPSEKPWRGTATCPLHESRPEREEFTRLGYPKCNRIELPNEAEAREHLRKKHPQTLRQMQEARAELDRVGTIEDREINRQILAKLAGVDLEEPVSVVSKSPIGDIPPYDVSTTTTATVPSATTASIVWEVPSHVHRYGKAMGSKCKVTGCTEVRATAFKTRRKKNGG